MIEMAEAAREDYRITRQEQDEYAAQSHERAAAADDAGLFATRSSP